MDAEILATEIYGIACSNLYYKKTKELVIEKLYKEIDRNFIQSLKK